MHVPGLVKPLSRPGQPKNPFSLEPCGAPETSRNSPSSPQPLARLLPPLSPWPLPLPLLEPQGAMVESSWAWGPATTPTRFLGGPVGPRPRVCTGFLAGDSFFGIEEDPCKVFVGGRAGPQRSFGSPGGPLCFFWRGPTGPQHGFLGPCDDPNQVFGRASGAQRETCREEIRWGFCRLPQKQMLQGQGPLKPNPIPTPPRGSNVGAWGHRWFRECLKPQESAVGPSKVCSKAQAQTKCKTQLSSSASRALPCTAWQGCGLGGEAGLLA